MNQYDNVRYDNAEDAARRMTDVELMDYHRQYREEDGEACGMGGRGLVDNPEWTYIKAQMRERGIAIP